LPFDKKVFELGDNYVIHENIYGLEFGDSDSMHDACTTLRNLEDYLGGKSWIEFTAEAFLHTSRQYYSISAEVKVERKRKSLISKVGIRRLLCKFERSVVKNWGYRPMFVGVVQISKQGKQLQFRSIPSVIRLKILDNSFDTTRFLRELSSPPRMVSLSGVTDRELALRFRDRFVGTNVELVSNVVEGTSQVMGEVAYQQSPCLGESTPPLDEILPILPRIVLGDGVWIELKETPNATLKRIQVKLCSSCLQPRAVQRMHELHPHLANSGHANSNRWKTNPASQSEPNNNEQ
jgi:hypothetical protein